MLVIISPSHKSLPPTASQNGLVRRIFLCYKGGGVNVAELQEQNNSRHENGSLIGAPGSVAIGGNLD